MTPEEEKAKQDKEAAEGVRNMLILWTVILSLGVIVGLISNSDHAPDCSPLEAAAVSCAIDIDTK